VADEGFFGHVLVLVEGVMHALLSPPQENARR